MIFSTSAYVIPVLRESNPAVVTFSGICGRHAANNAHAVSATNRVTAVNIASGIADRIWISFGTFRTETLKRLRRCSGCCTVIRAGHHVRSTHLGLSHNSGSNAVRHSRAPRICFAVLAHYCAKDREDGRPDDAEDAWRLL